MTGASFPDARGGVVSTAPSEWTKASVQEHPELSIENIVVPLDGTSLQRPAIPIAHEVARLLRATLHFVYMGDIPEEEFPAKIPDGSLGVTPFDMHGAVLHSVHGEGTEGMLSIAKQLANPVVMITIPALETPSDRLGPLAELALASRLRHLALVPAERGSKAWRLRRVLLAHDGTPGCQRATITAVELAHRSGAEVVALHVAEHGEPRPQEPGSIPAPLYIDQPQHEWPAWAEEFMNRLLATGVSPANVHFELALTGGQPGSEVAQVARDRTADLVVMAWHGHWEQEYTAARVVIATSGCPVLLVYKEENR